MFTTSSNNMQRSNPEDELKTCVSDAAFGLSLARVYQAIRFCGESEPQSLRIQMVTSNLQNSLVRASLYTYNVLSIFTLYFTNYTAFDQLPYKDATLGYKVRSTVSPAVFDCSNQRCTVIIIIPAQRARRQDADSWTSRHAAPVVWNDLPVDIGRPEQLGNSNTYASLHKLIT